jgi:RimJ/RimL family protein N-acetyltransferase
VKTPPFTVRAASPEDARGMSELFAATAAEGRWVLNEKVDVALRAGAFRETIADPTVGVFVAEGDGRVVGELIVRASRYGYADIGMDVAVDWRRRGVGTALMEACIDWAREQGLHKLCLEVFPHNEAGTALYRKMGFVDEGLRHKQYRRANGELWDSLAMGLVLDRGS